MQTHTPCGPTDLNELARDNTSGNLNTAETLRTSKELILQPHQQLKQAIIKEFSDPESEHGLIAALDTKQGRHETPHAYYHRLRQAYFKARNYPGMVEDTSCKSLFLRKLHPSVSHHLGIMTCRTMPNQQLRDLTQKAFNKHKASTKGVCQTPLILNFTTQNPKRAPEGTQHCHNAKPFVGTTDSLLANNIDKQPSYPDQLTSG
ncbi:uncharacterized protein LOC107752399 [Sinocyclocheilus rhinocerous]|uniref:uncharacterized protein LOC107752399 n=1 Tax=Sinocyclocheilus rhinocerous TaxID=307959 RepID=UPI0007B8FB3D|nr:PREDICTED: uncharacterized protein LOC107752399 [Sinocyclocheilus rhinocerous]